MLLSHLAAWTPGLLSGAGLATAAEPLRLVVSPAASARGNELAEAAIALLMRHAGLSCSVNLHVWVAPGQTALASGELERILGGNRAP
jgi:hypothetical protein